MNYSIDPCFDASSLANSDNQIWNRPAGPWLAYRQTAVTVEGIECQASRAFGCQDLLPQPRTTRVEEFLCRTTDVRIDLS
ncbi:Protein of unknown function [Pyronema omphalodes CBS 100304]|uniref:Uncharacterized protein n=1 Tax=Pyronema omphalodes (strain CBS 100304) TaxID=1076935 RepID=U4L3C4_PYROM|nr:Protein of unknown function [Pyronema omphalodes CBS 100304]